MADIWTKEKRSEIMSRIRSRDTGPELVTRSVLHKLGYRFTVSGPKNRELPGRPDIVLPRHRVVIFVHGCFWHRHKGCKISSTPKTRTQFWVSKFEANEARDRRNMRKLRRMHWKIMVVWECQTHNRCKLSSVLKRKLAATVSSK